MNQTDCCDHCGASLVEYKQCLSKGLAGCLSIIIQAGKGSHELSALNLTYSQRSNFSKLKYWGLVKKEGDPLGKGGKWYATSLGLDFMEGKTSLPKCLYTFRDEVIPNRSSEKLINMSDITEGYMYRADYAREAVSHNARS